MRCPICLIKFTRINPIVLTKGVDQIFVSFNFFVKNFEDKDTTRKIKK